MADERNILRTISWAEVFSCSNIFKSFKMALHPSKIILALVALGLTLLLGSVMDSMWAGASDSNRVRANEPWEYWTAESRTTFLAGNEKWREETRVKYVADKIQGMKGLTEIGAGKKLVEEDFSDGVAKLREKLDKARETALKDAEKDFNDKIKTLNKDKELAEDKKAKQVSDAEEKRLKAKRKALANLIKGKRKLDENVGGTIFASFVDWQGYCLGNALSAVRRGNFSTGLSSLNRMRAIPTPERAPAAYSAGDARRAFSAATGDAEPYGLVCWLILALWGLWWMISAHWLYAIVFLLAALGIWAVLGGAICRIAALHAGREEKISIASAVKFSLSKVMSFVGAPLLPLAIIVISGLLMSLAGFVGLIPGVGELLVAVFFLLALIGGAIMAFLSIGLVGGAPLMWPTIAVEGSDSFDAVSRSFSYVFARPFRYVLYLVIAAVHGTICYLFVRLFAFLTLSGTHRFVGWTMNLDGRETYAEGAGKLDVMWAAPTFNSFHGPMQGEVAQGWEGWTSYILAGWVYLVAGVVLAFLACYTLSAMTNIYLILRRKVDATDLDDVYVEEEEEIEGAEAVVEAPAEQPAEEEEAAEEDAGDEDEDKGKKKKEKK